MRTQHPAIGDLYEAAVRLLHDPDFPGRLRLVAHALREIGNRLPDAVAGKAEVGHLQYPETMDDIAKLWQRAAFARDGTMPDPSLIEEMWSPHTVEVKVPRKLFQRLARFVNDHLNVGERRVAGAIRLFERAAPSNQRAPEALHLVVAEWLATTRWFVSRAHENLRDPSPGDLPALEAAFERMEAMLFSVTRPYFEEMEKVDAILRDANR